MGSFFISHKWRLRKVVWFLMIFEFPFTVANLALFGIASPDLYRTILWTFGGKMGWSSDPSTVLYAYANYRPVSIPLVWSSFNTQYHLVIGVMCMFFFLVKATLLFLHVLYPIVSVLLHAALASVWAYGIYIQTSPDTIDPTRKNDGPPWYITKNCNVVPDSTIRAYCMQAKSAFAVSIIMMSIYIVFMFVSIYSVFPTKEQKSKRSSKLAEKRAEKEHWSSNHSPVEEGMTADQQWQHMWELQQLPRAPHTPGTVGGMKSPMTPRTVAFNNLGGAEAGHSNISRAWQDRYGGQGGVDVNPIAEEGHTRFADEPVEKAHTGMAY